MAVEHWLWNQGIEGSNRVINDDLCEAFDVQQTSSQHNQLSLFSRQQAYMLAQITDGAARAIVRNEDAENGFEIWRRLRKQFSLPERARSTNLLNEIIGSRLRDDHLESDVSEFMMLKDRHEKTTGRLLDNDLLITPSIMPRHWQQVMDITGKWTEDAGAL
ncbi:hypothetical protein AK812_SmicGene12713 [Symbiodinium microadriaticum]|uniref:Uncharacterized protein n=1 Tax=Symbiodinium microadriaticum TaxID=2951 RepID=A0A1Q9E9X9_SYMMI|nr:hypothetical protein AK812_SmicGene12713 [Symbiodinium microadriaticum]